MKPIVLCPNLLHHLHKQSTNQYSFQQLYQYLLFSSLTTFPAPTDARTRYPFFPFFLLEMEAVENIATGIFCLLPVRDDDELEPLRYAYLILVYATTTQNIPYFLYITPLAKLLGISE
jgi:hypothetical protein